MKSYFVALLTRAVIPAALIIALACPTGSFAQTTTDGSADQDHVVSSQGLQQQLQNSSADRQKNIDTINQLLSTPQAQSVMHDRHIDAQQVRNAVPTLSDKELASLGARASHAQQDFAAGHIGPSLFTLIIILIIVIIIVAIVH
jgi:CHASE3 domain sensor protein